MPELLYLIDVSSLVFQVFHAIPEMTSPRGQPTNAVFGFTRDILTILRKNPTHVLCAGDSGGPGEREKVFAAYKANRSAMPDELVPQFPLIFETIEAFGIPVLEVPGWEADDVIATTVESAAGRDMDVCIVTNDKDARQLISPRVRIYNVRKDQFLAEPELLAEWGIRPDQVIDFQALVGDSVDNVPGVPLVGPKKAGALLAQFGTLEGVLAHADEAPGAKLRENLKAFAEQARVSRQLVALRRDLPVPIDWDAAHVGRWNEERLQELFREFGFRRFGDEVRALAGGMAAPAPSVPLALSGAERPSLEPAAVGGSPVAARSAVRRLPKKGGTGQPSLFGDTECDESNTLLSSSAGRKVAGEDEQLSGPGPDETGPAPATGPHGIRRALEFQIVDTPQRLAGLVDELRSRQTFCLDLETTSRDPLRGDIVGWAFSWEPHKGFYIPVRAPAGQPQLDAVAVVDALRPVLENPSVHVSNQNIKYDMLVLRRAGINLAGIGVDPMLGSYLLEAGARSHSLDELSRRYLRHEMIPISMLIGKGMSEKRLDEVEVRLVAEYAVEDAEVSWELSGLISRKLREQGLWELYWNLERPLIEVLVEMEANGIRVDAGRLREQSRSLEDRLSAMRREIYAAAGREFNIDSPKQLQQVLFRELGLPVLRRTKTGASTDQDVLERLALEHPLPSLLLEHRTLTKLKGTYLDALPQMINPDTGKIHTSFNQVVAATGRLSSSDPNLQNIPIRADEGRRVREAFVPFEPDWRLLCADYSQIELRMLAHFSDDKVLCAAFEEGIDIHTAVASQIYGVGPEAVDGEMRRVAKAVNFGVIYGQSPFGLSAAIGISKGDAARFIDNYFERYSGVDKYLERLLADCMRTGFATTIMGRRRSIAGIRRQPQPGRQRNLPERTAINTVIQGSAADLIKQAMLNVFARLKRERHPGRILLQIHDELVLESPADRIADLGQLVREEMEQALKLRVPLKVDVSAGSDWLNTEPLE
jgi:DNA polymerase-1